MAEYDGSPQKDSPGTQRGQRNAVPARPGASPDASTAPGDAVAQTGRDPAKPERPDVQAGQEGDRAAAAIDNQREGYGGPSGSRQGRSTGVAEGASEVARRQGESDG